MAQQVLLLCLQKMREFGMKANFHTFKSKEDLVDSFCKTIIEKLENAIKTKEKAVLLVSGGNTPKVLGLFGTGGNVACIGGYQKLDDKHMIYLIDPHGDSPEMDFEKCNGIGRGGQGWVDLKESIMYGNHIFKKTENEFLEFNPAIIVLFNGIDLTPKEVKISVTEETT